MGIYSFHPRTLQLDELMQILIVLYMNLIVFITWHRVLNAQRPNISLMVKMEIGSNLPKEDTFILKYPNISMK